MIHALVLALVSPTPLQVPQPRARAAQVLRQAIQEPQAEAGLATWIAAARAAIAELGPGAFAATLEESIVDARWRALTDPVLAGEAIEQELRAAAEDLEFLPVREAELPLGFPEPTPVREIELKRYPRYRMVRADMRDPLSNGAFWKLFSHIEKNDIAMTAPVETTHASEGEDWHATGMAFLYGSPDIGDVGIAGDVEVVDAEPALYLSLGCRGQTSRASLAEARARLVDWVEGQDVLEVAGELRSMSYNSPMVPDSRRYYEVQVPVRRKPNPSPDNLVIDFGDEGAARRWTPVDDGVMGGLSSSRFNSGEGSCVFEGRVSLENNGGFASVRTRPAEMGLAGAKALRLAYRGDGKTYKLRLRTNDAFDGVSYEVVFPTEDGVWQARSFAAGEFVPVWRGRRVRDAGALVFANVRSVGLMISDKQVGPFRLEVSALFKE